MNPVPVLILLCLCSTKIFAQADLKGIWNGSITTDGQNAEASYIINIEEHKDGIISGRALLYKPNIYAEAFGLQQFFGTISGNMIKISDVVILDERLPTSKYFLCFKLSSLVYKINGGRESLTGHWQSNSPTCLPGKISLTRFHENSENTNDKVPDYVLKAVKSPGKAPQFKNTELSAPLVFTVKNHSINLKLKDYLKSDNDTVSIYLNRRLIINKLNISKKPFKFSVRLARNLPTNELILYANNLGQIPPNTSLLTISDGETRHRVLIESTLQKSVAIYLNRIP